MKLGGADKIVEIDESVIGRTKYNVGRRREQQWLFGCIERGSSNIFIKCVDTKTKNEPGGIIREVIADKTLIISDEWPAYMSFFGNAPEYKHLSVNHTENFVDPISRAHTQNIERIWGKLKTRLRDKNF